MGLIEASDKHVKTHRHADGFGTERVGDEIDFPSDCGVQIPMDDALFARLGQDEVYP